MPYELVRLGQASFMSSANYEAKLDEDLDICRGRGEKVHRDVLAAAKEWSEKGVDTTEFAAIMDFYHRNDKYFHYQFDFYQAAKDKQPIRAEVLHNISKTMETDFLEVFSHCRTENEYLNICDTIMVNFTNRERVLSMTKDGFCKLEDDVICILLDGSPDDENNRDKLQEVALKLCNHN